MTTSRTTQHRPASPPTGTVTFLFTDIEGSTRLVESFGDAFGALLERHRQALRDAVAEHAGWEHGTEGDSFFVVFADAPEAVEAAVAGQRALAAIDWPPGGRVRVRMGLHTGEGRLMDDDYVGLDVHRAARIAAAGHGGQVLLSQATRVLAERALPAGVALLDLGDHRLKDLPAAERLSQLVIDGLQAAFPPIRSLDRRVLNLPAQLSSFVGREPDLAAVGRLLAASRLVTVTGVGGTGKTRLVQEVARSVVSDYGDGATFVPLEAIRDPDLAPVEILRALRLDIAAARPPRERLLEIFADRRALLVLDNLEHLPGVATLVRQLLDAAPGLTVLASSQAALHLAGEQEYTLEPLALPDPSDVTAPQLDRLAETPSVRLFLERARAVRPDFTLDGSNAAAIAAICARLDGLPLAIELAAAQVKVLSPAAILNRIGSRLEALASRRDDLPERQRTLRAAVGWSYDLLPDPDQCLLRRLSVFVGGARLTEIEALVEGTPSIPDVFSALEGLVDRSLVSVRRQPGVEDRFAMLETVRAVARELLQEAGEEAAAVGRHADLYRDLAARAEPELYRTERRVWLDRLAGEHDNLRAALDQLEAAGDLNAALAMAANLWRFWQQRGHLGEAHDRLQALLAAAAARQDGSILPAVLSHAEEAAGSVGYWMRTTAGHEVEGHYLRSVELARQAQDPDREAWALYNLAFMYDFVPSLADRAPEPERALQMREEALRLFREVGDRRGIGESLWALGGSATAVLAEPARSRQQLLEASRELTASGNVYGASWTYLSLGVLEAGVGDLDLAREWVLRGAEIFLRDDDLAGQLIAVQGLGSLAARAGDDQTAVRLAACASAGGTAISVDLPEIAPIVEPIREAEARLPSEDLERERAGGAALQASAILQAELEARHGATAGRTE